MVLQNVGNCYILHHSFDEERALVDIKGAVIMNITCWSCLKEIEVGDRIGRTEECPKCYADLHVCRMCKFWDTSAAGECREPNADRVLKKEKSNFCDYFSVRSDLEGDDKVSDAKAKLDALFKNL